MIRIMIKRACGASPFFERKIEMNKKWIRPDHPALQYMGRIDFDDPQNPVWVFPSTFVKVRFTGTGISALVTNMRGCWDNYLGIFLDGVESKILLEPEGRQEIILAAELENREHELLLFKRMDSCHQLIFHGLMIEEDAEIFPPEPLPCRRIEVYGDSVSAGEVSEAVEYCGQVDPPHNGEYSNSYYSYAWYTARMLDAQLHNIAQGGIALLEGTGYFHAPDYLGMEYMYDKIQYNTQIAPAKQWDFARYTPHVVIVAIGQNDNHPHDYMWDNYDHPKARNWRTHYAAFIRQLRSLYPKAVIILSTTILNHWENWDKSIHAVWQELNDPKVHHFLYSNNGCGTHGHIRIPEAEQMGRELSSFILSLGPEIWED